METFVQRHSEDVIGVLSGLDRVLLRGTLRSISYGKGLDRFLGAMGVRYKDFGAFAEGLSERLKQACPGPCRISGPSLPVSVQQQPIQGRGGPGDRRA